MQEVKTCLWAGFMLPLETEHLENSRSIKFTVKSIFLALLCPILGPHLFLFISFCPALVPVTEPELNDKLSQALVEKRTASKKPDNAASIAYVSFVHYCGHFYLCSWPVLVNLGEGCNNIVEPVGLDMSPVHFKRQTCGGAAAHYVIMLSKWLFILTSSSRTVTSAPTAAPSIGGGSQLFQAKPAAAADLRHDTFRVSSNAVCMFFICRSSRHRLLKHVAINY